MEYRAWITVPDLPYGDEASWGPVIAHLERERGDLGPIIGWDDDGTARFVLATSASDEPTAARIIYAAMCAALRAVGAQPRYPTGVELEAA